MVRIDPDKVVPLMDEAASGAYLAEHGEKEGARGAASPRQLSGRGLAYWSDGTDERILYSTPGFRLVALDAQTGLRIPGFGDEGLIDLKAAAVYGVDQPIDPVTGEIDLHATPTVAGGIVIADQPDPAVPDETATV